jgi:uncharacterized protein (DUF488 family)
MSISGIGYEGLTLDAFVSKLRINSIQTLVDVRLNAISRKRGFSKRALSEALEAAGIAYVHLPALGNQRDNRAGYSELRTDLAVEVRDRFREVLQSEEAVAVLQLVAELARDKNVALFCYEKDEQHCHREQVLEAVRLLVQRDLIAS